MSKKSAPLNSLRVKDSDGKRTWLSLSEFSHAEIVTRTQLYLIPAEIHIPTREISVR